MVSPRHTQLTIPSRHGKAFGCCDQLWRHHAAGFAHDQGGIQLSKLHLLLDGIRPSGFLGPCQLLATFVAGGVKLEGLPPGVRAPNAALTTAWGQLHTSISAA